MTPDRPQHPLLDEWLAWLQGAASPERAAVIRDHGATCSLCRETIEWLRETLEIATHGPLPEPPDEVLHRALDILPASRTPGASGWSIAELVRDSLADTNLAGVRGGSESERRLFYRTGAAVIDLEVAPADEHGGLRVTGQVFPQGPSVADHLIASLHSEDGWLTRALADPEGVFTFPKVPPGRYRLDLVAPEDRTWITIEDLTLGEP